MEAILITKFSISAKKRIKLASEVAHSSFYIYCI